MARAGKNGTRLVMVTWKDSTYYRSSAEWTEDEVKHLGLTSLITVGILVHESDDAIYLANEKCEEKNEAVKYRGLNSVAKSLIVELKHLRARGGNHATPNKHESVPGV